VQLKAPFPWYGGKTLAAPLIWQALGNPPNFVEPFAGSLAVLLNRPHTPMIETVNDKDAFVANVFRAIRDAPDEVVAWADRPVNEADLHAIHTWLVGQRETFTARVMGDPDWYDAKVAGRWLWGICCWIGGGWCSGEGPWQSVNGRLVRCDDGAPGVHRNLVHLGDAGRGVHRTRVHLGGHGGGMGIHAAQARGQGLAAWMYALADRLRAVRVCCGDWTRVLGPSVTWTHGVTGILLDPPYAFDEGPNGRDPELYRVEDGAVAYAVEAWCLANGHNPLLRIVLCGYGTTHDGLLEHGWRVVSWVANGGYGVQRRMQDNRNRYEERLWLSPACFSTLSEQQLSLPLGEGRAYGG
jgi:D12 class N6 adenine-specific DNA methyltransferase